jgi:predicted metal-binding protein
MKKIGILNCLKANEVCTGASCLMAFNQRSRGFAPYAGEEIQLAAFLRCNGCDSVPLEDPGMMEKLERLAAENVEIVHLGVCTKLPNGSLCPKIAQIRQKLESLGITVIQGTH